MRCFFASDLHGHLDRYETLFATILEERPAVVFLGGDLFPGPWIAPAAIDPSHRNFVDGFLGVRLASLRETLGAAYPRVFVILGNDDGRADEAPVLALGAAGIWDYLHDRTVALGGHPVLGYNCIPPSPFALKDWERYDVSRYVDPGCVSPEDGTRSVPMAGAAKKYGTIAQDLEALGGTRDLSNAVLLFHCPPYRTKLDRADLDGRAIDHVPLDPHIGSVAIRRFIEARQPRLGLFGHVHESARLTGSWRDEIGRTVLLSAAHDGPELALVEFDLEAPEGARRRLL